MPFITMDRSLSWGDVLVAAGLLISGVLAFAALETDISVSRERINHIGAGTNAVHQELQRHMQDEREAREAIRAELRTELKDINAKLDKLIEREANRGPAGGQR